MTEKEIDALAEKYSAKNNKRGRCTSCNEGHEYKEADFKAGYQAAMKELEKLKKERDAYKKVVEEWMNDFDKLKTNMSQWLL